MGMFTKRDKDGTERWYGSYCYQGKRHDGYALRRWNGDAQKEPTNRREATAALERFREDVRQGRPLDGGTRLDPANMSFGEFITYYKTHYVEEQRKLGKMRGSDSHSVFAVMGRDPIVKVPLKDLETPVPLTAFLGRLRSEVLTMTVTKKNGQTRTINLKRKRRKASVDKFLIRLNHMMKFAKALGLITISPFERDAQGLLKKQAPKGGKRRRLSASEEKVLRAELDPIMTNRLDFALATGVRRGELQALQFKHVDMDAAEVTIDGTVIVEDEDGCAEEVSATKSGKTRTIPLSPDTLAIVVMRKQLVRHTKFGNAVMTVQAEKSLREAHIFGNEFGHKVLSFKRSFLSALRRSHLDATTLKAAGKQKLVWHDLRGEAVTRMLERGANAVAVMNIAGHSELKTTLAYYQGEMKDAMRKAVQG